MIEILDQPVTPHSADAGLVRYLGHAPDASTDQCLAAIAYAAFFTEAERDEIGTFDELPAPEQARWQSVAAHVARTVVSPVTEDLGDWRAEQDIVLAEQVRDAPYSWELWRAMTRTASLQQQIASLKDLIIASRACVATARSHSRRLASSAEALDSPIWSAHPGSRHPDGDASDTAPRDDAHRSPDATGMRINESSPDRPAFATG